MSRILSALPSIPQSEQIPHFHAPNGGMCRTCKFWDDKDNPNFGHCRSGMGRTNSDWSCVFFVKKTDWWKIVAWFKRIFR